MIRNWAQGAGDGTSYALHTEDGQPVLVQGSGAETWTDCVLWRSQALADAHKGKKFSDLHYSSDDNDDSGDEDSDDTDNSDEDDSDSDSDDSDDDSDDNQADTNDDDDTDTTTDDN